MNTEAGNSITAEALTLAVKKKEKESIGATTD